MQFFYKKIFIALLIILLIAPTAFFVKPKKADAIIGCALNALGILGSIGGMMSGAMAIPVSDKAVTQSTATSAREEQTQSMKECLLDAVVSNLVNNFIKTFTASTVQWINSGFQGSPAFVTNPGEFFADYGDIVAGQMIQELGPVGQILCSPFDLDIKIALSFGFGLNLGSQPGRYSSYVGCRLSDVQANMYRAFTSGVWGGSTGWSNWISISHPRNNSMSVYLSTQDAFSTRLSAELGLKSQEINLGRGFLNFTECVEYSQIQVGPDNYEKGPCIREVTKTPGSVIEGQLQQALPSGLRKIEMADEIDEIMRALTDQLSQVLTKGVFSGAGLLGQSQPSSRYGGKTALSRIRQTLEEQQMDLSVRPPAGLICEDGPFAIAPKTIPTVDGKIILGGEKDLDGDNNEIFVVYHWDKNEGRHVYDSEKQINKDYIWNTAEEKFEFDVTSGATTRKETIIVADLENQFNLGCDNTRTLRTGDQMLTDYFLANPETFIPETETEIWSDPNRGLERNLAFRASAEASSMYTRHGSGTTGTDHGAHKLVDGVIIASVMETALTKAEGAHTSEFFKITLNEPSIITKIRIYPANIPTFKYSSESYFLNTLYNIMGVWTDIKLENTKEQSLQTTQATPSFFIRFLNTAIGAARYNVPKLSLTLNTHYEKINVSNSWDLLKEINYKRPLKGGLLNDYLNTFGYYELIFPSLDSRPAGEITKNNFIIADRLTIEKPLRPKPQAGIDCPGSCSTWLFPLAISEVEIYGVPESEFDDYKNRGAAGENTQADMQSLTQIRTSNINGVVIYQNQYQPSSLSYSILTQSPVSTPKIKITAELSKISGQFGEEKIDFDVLFKGSFNIHQLGAVGEKETEDNKLIKVSNTFTTSEQIPIQNLWFKIDKAEVTTTGNIGFYRLKLIFTEKETGKAIGQHLLNFEIRE